PPTNHLANGGFDQTSTWSHFSAQSSASACSAQNASGSAAAFSWMSGSETTACSAKSPGGEKVSWSSSSSSWASSVVSAIRSLLSQQRHRGGASPRRPHVVPLVTRERLIGAE